MTEAFEIRHYLNERGKDVFATWIDGLSDSRTKAKIAVRIDRLAVGNFGACKSLGRGLYELRVDWAQGFRVYYALIGTRCVLLLCGGSKSTQVRDIARAYEYFEDYKNRTKKSQA